MPWIRSSTGNSAGDMQPVSRTGPGNTIKRLLHHQLHMSSVQGAGQSNNETVHELQGNGQIENYKNRTIKNSRRCGNGFTIDGFAAKVKRGNLEVQAVISTSLSMLNHMNSLKEKIIIYTARFLLSFVQASLGATIEVMTLNGTEKLKIPKGTQSGTIFRLKGKGIPHLKGFGRGDQIIETVVKIPTNLNRKQEELLKEFAKLSGEK